MVKYTPATLAEALKIRNSEQVIPYAGGTDLMVENRKDAVYLFLNRVKELQQIREDETYVRIGSGVTFTQALQSDLVPALMKEAVSHIAAPAIRNAGTFGGNLGNGSAKADSVLVEYVTDSKLKLVSQGEERIVAVQDFYRGRRDLDLKENELIAEILIPKAGIDDYYYQKVGGRNALAISRVSFAGILNKEDGKVKRVAVAFGAVADTVLRFRQIEEKMTGLSVDESRAMKEEFIRTYADTMVLTRGRVSAEYRKAVCSNLLRAFLDQML